MRYMKQMDTTEELASLYIVTENTSQLLYALEDLGYDDLDVCAIDGGFGLFIDDTLLAVGLAEDPVEATENLLDRAADIFYHDIIEV